MSVMIPYESVFMDAMRQSQMMDNGVKSNVTVPFHPGLYKYGSQPEGNPGRVAAMNTDYMNLGAMAGMQERNLNGMQGGEGGGQRSYVPQQDATNTAFVPPATYEPSTGMTVQEPPAPAPEQPAQNGGLEEQEKQIEQVAQFGTIDQLLDALKQMASMQPGEQGHPVFQLDAMYKGSSALGGLPGTVAQYPTAGGVTRETDYSL